MTVKIVPVRAAADTSTNWASANPIPKLGEACLIIDTGYFKWGDGVTPFNDLPLAKGAVAWGGIGGTLSAQTDLQAALDGKQNSITPAALTKSDDSNVTLTLGGSPSTALLAGVSLALGWNGQLPVSRGGTGTSSATGTGSLVLGTTPTFTTNASISSTSSAILNMTADSGGTSKLSRLQVVTGTGDFLVRGLYAKLCLDFTTELQFRAGSTSVCDINTSGLVSASGGFAPKANDGAALGSATVGFADLFLASGAVINFANGNATITHSSGKIAVDVPWQLRSYTVGTVPAASLGAGSMIYVSNESGGAVTAVSDGTNWRRVPDNAVIY